MKKQTCQICRGMGSYIGVVPPGKDVRVKCHCGAKTRNQTDKFCTDCLKPTRLLVHCGKFTQKRG